MIGEEYYDFTYCPRGVAMKLTIITCDVIGCGEDAYREVDCCKGWKLSDGCQEFKKFEKPSKAEKSDLCDKHWKEWSKITCKLLKMDKEIECPLFGVAKAAGTMVVDEFDNIRKFRIVEVDEQ